MSIIAPFCAVRPARDKAHLVASRSYVTYGRNDLLRKLSENPYTFIHIINPEYNAPKKSKPNSDERFRKVKSRYKQFLEDGILMHDAQKQFYIYKQITPFSTFSGIICGVSVEDYVNGKVKIHEHTLTHREEVFCRYLDICDFNAEPVLLTHPSELEIYKTLLPEVTERVPEYDFTTTDRTRHQLWCVNNEDEIREITDAYATLDALYIADGHHRSASSARLSALRKKNNTNMPYNDACDYILSFIIPGSQVKILPFNRLVELPAGTGSKDLLTWLENKYHVEETGHSPVNLSSGQYGLRVKEGWFIIQSKEKYQSTSPVDALDSTRLTEDILKPYFGIEDPKTDKRISYIPGIEDISNIEKSISKEGNQALFTLQSVSPKTLFAVADSNGIMPPKSTWVAPKLRSGLVIMPLS